MNDIQEFPTIMATIVLIVALVALGIGLEHLQFGLDAASGRLEVFNNKVYKFVEVKP